MLLNQKLHWVYACEKSCTTESNPVWGAARRRVLCGDPPHLHLNRAMLMQVQEESTGREGERKKKTLGWRLVNNAFVCQTNK